MFFSDATNTGCGQASAQTGPFYCPVDRKVYFDLDFLTAAPGHVRCHRRPRHAVHRRPRVRAPRPEPGRHQRADATGAAGRPVTRQPVLGRARVAGRLLRRRRGRDNVRDRGLFDNPQEVEEALNAAAAVGDDRIQQKTQGRVDPESFTHGTSAQRVAWFKRGFDTGDPNRCTTFSEVLVTNCMALSAVSSASLR